MEKTELKKLLRACALEFREGMSAPVVRAYAKGLKAERLVEIARKNRIPVREEEANELLDALGSVRVNTSIPPEIYAAIARVFAYVFLSQKDTSY